MNWRGPLADFFRCVGRRRLGFSNSRRVGGVRAFFAGEQGLRGFSGGHDLDQVLRAVQPGSYSQLAADIGNYVFENVRCPAADAERSSQFQIRVCLRAFAKQKRRVLVIKSPHQGLQVFS